MLSNIREIQLYQLAMLKELDRIFKEEGISYFAVGGTALGAVRHSGFIPWDDDIDIAMLREDYEKFLQLEHRLPDSFSIMNHASEKNYPIYFSKVLNKDVPFFDIDLLKYDIGRYIFIDVFPWDELENWKLKKKKLNKIRRNFKKSVFKKHGSYFDTIKFSLYKLMNRFKSSDTLFAELDAASRALSGRGTGTWGYAMLNDVLTEDQLFPLRQIRFEGMDIPVPNKVEEYLSHKYGDYMQLPDEKDRVNHST